MSIPPPQGCIRTEGTQRLPQRGLHRRLEEGAKAVGGRYCRLQMPLKLALGVRETVAGQRLGALEGGGGGGGCGRSGRQNAATRRNMRREERVTVQGPVKKQQPDGMLLGGGGGGRGGISPPLQCIPAPHGGGGRFQVGKK